MVGSTVPVANLADLPWLKTNFFGTEKEDLDFLICSELCWYSYLRLLTTSYEMNELIEHGINRC